MLNILSRLCDSLASPLSVLPFILGVILGLAPISAFAQQDLAKLEGVVKDQTGAVIPGATVTIRSEALNIERKVTTSVDGLYSFPQLRPAAYLMTVEAANFSKAEIKDLILGVGQTRSLDVELKPGSLTGEMINIVASETPSTIDSSSNRLGVNVTEREVEELPVNGRNYSQLQLLTPGATNAGTGNANEVRFNSRSNEQNQTRLDGIESTAIWDASPGYLTVQGSQFRLHTSLENIQEFRVDSSNYPAEYGTGTGGQINVIGKSGSNDFHGAIFEYLRNDALDARNFFDGSVKSKLRLNQFGGSLGGPIIKNRLFFFGSYEGLRQRSGFNSIELTPSTISRDFINFVGTDDPRGAAASAALGITPNAAALTRIQALRALGAINAFPIGSGAPVDLGGANNSAQFVQTNRVATLDEDAFSVRFDGKINERFNGYIRYQRDDGDLDSPDGTSGRFIVASQKPDNLVLALSQLFGTNIVNETKFGINRASTTLDTSIPVIDSLINFQISAISLSGTIVQTGVNGGAPTGIVSPGGLTRQSSAASGRAQPIDPRSFSLIDNLSWIRGNHAMKFGGELRKIEVNFDQLGGFTYTYGSILDFLLNQNLTTAFTGDLSAPGSFSIATNPITTFTRDVRGFHRGRQYFLIGYAQDEWKIRPNFTMNFGLRYEFYSTNRERNDRDIIFDAASGRLLDPGSNFYHAVTTNFGPRLAFTWAPAHFKNKTLIRIGGGLYYGPGQYEDLIQPIESDVPRITTGFPGGLTATTAQTVTNFTLPITNFTPRAYDVNGYRVPERIGQYGLSIQQELPGNMVLTLAYVGSQGRNLFLRNITNTILPGAAIIPVSAALPGGIGIINRIDPAAAGCATRVDKSLCVVNVVTARQFDLINFSLVNGVPTPTSGSRLNPFGEIDYKTSGGRDSFNAMQVMLNRRFTTGLTLGAQYQWGHSIGDTQGSNEAQTVQNPFDYNADRGNNTFDIRHSANITALYELPIGQGMAVNLSGPAEFFLSRWMVGGVINIRSGLPMDLRVTRADVVIQCTNPSFGCPAGQVLPLPSTINAASPLPAGFTAVINTPGGNASRATRRPDVVPGVDPFQSLDGNLGLLNSSAFAIPQPGTYGNLARNAIYGPSFKQFDLILQKNFKITEAVIFQFRTEFYNLFNKANFANPPVTLNLPPSASLQPGQPIPAVTAGNFGIINATVGRTVGLGTSRQIQFSGRITF